MAMVPYTMIPKAHMKGMAMAWKGKIREGGVKAYNNP